MTSSTRLEGHVLQHDGKPYEICEQDLWVRVYGSPAGVGLCSCGKTGPVLRSDAARKRWHESHKDDVRNGRQEPEVAPHADQDPVTPAAAGPVSTKTEA